MKVTAISLLFLSALLMSILMSNVSAIEITEVEINPPGGSSGKEWIELFNEGSEVNLSGWAIWEGVSGQSGPKKINYNFSEDARLQTGEFYIIELSSSLLNNAGDFAVLYDSSGNKIDETINLKDSTSGSETWQLCGGNWAFLGSTKGQENNCPGEEQEETEENLSSEDNSSNEETLTPSSETNSSTTSSNTDFVSTQQENSKKDNLSSQSKESDTIYLSPKKSDKETFVSSDEKLRNYMLYFFMALVIFFCFYLAFKRI